jgi:hypothetical protein
LPSCPGCSPNPQSPPENPHHPFNPTNYEIPFHFFIIFVFFKLETCRPLIRYSYQCQADPSGF